MKITYRDATDRSFFQAEAGLQLYTLGIIYQTLKKD